MPVPTHDITCDSRAIPTVCNDCRAEVWYFSCTCGSKVFFNELGHPWEQHFCREYGIRKNLEMLVDMDKMTSDQVYKALIERESKTGEITEDQVWKVVESVLGKRKSKLSIKKVLPFAGYTEVSGKVMELNKTINIFTRLGYDASNVFSVKLLGNLAKDNWGYARIRTNPDRKNECLEFEVLFMSTYLANNSLEYGNFILGVAEGIEHPKGIIWKLIKHQVY